MPCDYSRYPKDWKAIRAEVLERAGHRCEQCGVRNHDHVWRGTAGGRPVYQIATLEVYDAVTGELLCDTGLDIDMDAPYADKLTKVVLTISHTDHDVTNNGSPGDRPNLRALCQRCHLAHDADVHRANARATRYRKSCLKSLFDQH